jgi:hypothetical protein
LFSRSMGLLDQILVWWCLGNGEREQVGAGIAQEHGGFARITPMAHAEGLNLPSTPSGTS